jgi:hypothetical protein
MNILDLFIITDSTRHPWEWLAARAQNYWRDTVFFGFFYAAVGTKPAA